MYVCMHGYVRRIMRRKADAGMDWRFGVGSPAEEGIDVGGKVSSCPGEIWHSARLYKAMGYILACELRKGKRGKDR